MEKVPRRTRRKKDEARSLAHSVLSERGMGRVRLPRSRTGGETKRRSRTHFANSLARCFSGLHFATSPRVRRPLESRSADWKTRFSMLRAMNEGERHEENPTPSSLSLQKSKPQLFRCPKKAARRKRDTCARAFQIYVLFVYTEIHWNRDFTSIYSKCKLLYGVQLNFHVSPLKCRAL